MTPQIIEGENMNAVAKTAPAETLPVPSESAAIFQVIERAASNPAVDIDKLERLLQMREREQVRVAQAAYAAALSKLQPDLPIIAERGAIRGSNGKEQSKYALWEDVVSAITPILARHGFSLSFRTGNEGAGITVTGVLMHELGHSEQTSLTLPIDTSGSKNAVQSVGSSTSYGKRYTAAALLNLRTGQSEDDDGQRGGGAATITDVQVGDLTALADEVGANMPGFLKYLGVGSLADIRADKYHAAVSALEAKRKRS